MPRVRLGARHGVTQFLRPTGADEPPQHRYTAVSMSGVAPIPSNPFHIARAYGVQAPAAARPTVRPLASEPVEPIATIRPQMPTHRLAAGVVPGKVTFSGAGTLDAGPALPMYRHPADRNAAATALSAGRMLDVEA